MSDPIPLNKNSRVEREAHLRWVALGDTQSRLPRSASSNDPMPRNTRLTST
jgi:hypothetical protein